MPADSRSYRLLHSSPACRYQCTCQRFTGWQRSVSPVTGFRDPGRKLWKPWRVYGRPGLVVFAVCIPVFDAGVYTQNLRYCPHVNAVRHTPIVQRSWLINHARPLLCYFLFTISAQLRE